MADLGQAPPPIEKPVMKIRSGVANVCLEVANQAVCTLYTSAHVVEVGRVARGEPRVSLREVVGAQRRAVDGKFVAHASETMGVDDKVAIPRVRNFDAVASTSVSR